MHRFRPGLPVIALLAMLVVLPGCDRIESRLIARATQRVASPDHGDWLDDGALHVVLCGTGSPLPGADRAGPCTAVIAGGHFLVIDAGLGSMGVINLHRIPPDRIDGVLLTHLHSDHIGGLGELAMQSWVQGRPAPLAVYGPAGVAQVVAGFEQAYAADTGFRIAHHGADLMVPGNRPLVAHTLPKPQPGAAPTVFEADGLRVSVFAVDHEPVTPAFGYRIEFAGRSVVISGDTKRSENLIEQARGVDLLVHEALAARLILAGRDAAAAAGRTRIERVLGDIVDYHTTPVEAAEVARASGAGMLVLTHLVPPPSGFIARHLFLRGVDQAWDGEVVLGEDGMHFALRPGTKQIEREKLD